MDAFRRRQLNQNLDEEINAHVALEVRRRVELGELPEEARTAALREMRGIAFVKEATRDAWAWGTYERLAQDLRYAMRTLRKSPVFTGIAILSLALGIGANTAIFTMINAVLLQTLPVDNPEHLVLLTSYQRDGLVGNFAYPDYQQLREGSRVFSGVLAASRPTPANAGVKNELERVLVQNVSGNYFSVLGVRPLIGRILSENDENSATAVISHSYWQRIFGGDPSVLGKSLTINGSLCSIIGVAPAGFFGETVGQSTDIWLSMATLQAVRPGPFNLRSARFVTWLYLMGRLKPDATIEQASSEAQVLVARLHAAGGSVPENDYLHHIVMESGSRGSAGLRNSLSGVLLVLMVLVAFVLLIACTNLAGLLLARATSRQREIATRLALGATRLRVVRQLLTESLLLAILGGLIGLMFAVGMNRFLLSMASEGIGAININLYPDGRVLLFSAAVAVLAGIMFGLAPAIQAVRIDVGPKLKTHSRTLTTGARRWGLRNALITVQITLSLVLLAGSLLFTRTLWNLKTVDTGFQPDNVLLVGFGPHDQRQETDLASRVIERVSAIPGVQSASVSVNTPLGSDGSGVTGLEFPGYTPRNEDDQKARANWVGPEYFKTLGIPLIRGREFSFSDTAGNQSVAIINETMARFYFGDRPAVGQRFRFSDREYEIVGVARDAKYRALRESTPRMVYFAFLQNRAGMNTLQLQTAGSPLELASAVRAAIGDVDGRLNIREIATLSSLIDRTILPEYLVASLSSFFSTLTLLLVCIGIYGTLAFTVSTRTNEIGIRIALGAGRASVLLMVIHDIVLPLAAGLVSGLLIVLASGPLLTSLLFGLSPSDPWTLAFAVLLFAAGALLAGYIPARVASRVDPVTALRFE